MIESRDFFDLSTNAEDQYAAIVKFLNAPVDELIRKRVTDGNNIPVYNDFRPTINLFKQYLSPITLERLQALPGHRYSILIQILSNLWRVLAEIASPGPPSETLRNPKPYIDHNFSSTYMNLVWSIVCETLVFETNSKQSVLEQAEVSREDTFRKELADEKKELKDLTTQAKQDLAKIGVEIHAGLFTDQAKINKTESKKWEDRIIGLLVFSVVILITMILIIIFNDSLSTSKRVQLSLMTIAIASIVSYATFLCTKNYFAEKHNQSLNEHRANALGTFTTFAKSTSDDEKKAILVQATQTIFGAQKSGFLTKDSEAGNPNLMIDVLRKILDKEAR